jgi:hypothetical protein
MKCHLTLSQNFPESQKSSLNWNESINGENLFADLRNFKSTKNNWVRKSQIRKSQKIYGSQIANPQIATFADVPQNYDNI